MDDSAFADDLSLLLNRGTSAVVCIDRINEAETNCIREYELFDDQIDNADDKIVFNSQSLVALQNEISPLLSTLRIIQDMVLPLIGRKLKISLPSSINDALLKLDNYGLPKELKEIIKRYWEAGGSAIRDYRILDQHYSGLVDYIFMQIRPNKKILLYFPDNPKVKSRKHLTYNKQINGLEVLKCGFDELHSFIELVAAFFGYTPKPLQIVIGMKQLGDLTPFQNRTLAFLFESPVTQKVDGSLQMNLSGVRFSQMETGQLSIQKMLLTESKLTKIQRLTKGST